MAVHGYITHAAHNKRCTALLVLGYVLAFEVIGTFALTMGLLYWDHEHTVLTDPAGYAIRYALPIAALAGLSFWIIYSGHAKAVTRALGIRIVAREDEPRFVQIAEEQCTALGVRLPRFGIIEAREPNALSAGEGPTKGLIAVTRGLLDQLDDDELAAVLAHEASHIRNGDTRLLAANHALMRTAVIMYMNNPLRLEDWRQLILGVLIPPMLILVLAGSMVTSFCMWLSRAARRGLKLGRDHVADGEAIRVTHFPEALLSAIAKVGGRGAFEGSYRVEGMLFDGRADHDGGSHPPIRVRLDAISSLGAELMNPARRRLDTRRPAQPGFGRRPRNMAAAYPLNAMGAPLEKPRPPSRSLMWLWFTDRELYMEWHRATVAWAESQLNEPRVLGLAPKLMIPLAVTVAAIGYLYWPKDGNLSKLAKIMNPAGMVDFARLTTHSGTFCSIGPHSDGKCGSKGAPAANANNQLVQNKPAGKPGGSAAPWLENSDHPLLPPAIVPILMFGLMGLGIFKPKLLRKLFGHVEPREIDRRMHRSDFADELEEVARSQEGGRGQVAGSPEVARSPEVPGSQEINWRPQPPPVTLLSPPVFGRRKVQPN